MFFLLVVMLSSTSYSLIYQKTSTTPIPISCSLSGTGVTMNITRYAEINPFTNVSWVWISNYDIVGDFCKVNFTFEYLAGSQVEISRHYQIG